MFGKFWNKKRGRVKVTFIEADKERVIGTYFSPTEKLPDTFEKATTLTIKSESYRVVRARPLRKPEILKKGKLELYIRKQETANTGTGFFSLPTLSGEVPHTSERVSPEGEPFVLQAGHWRQIEFMKAEKQDSIILEMSEVQAIRQEHQTDLKGGLHAYTKVHIRKNIPATPLCIPEKAFGMYFEPKDGYRALLLEGKGYVKNGFATKWKHGFLYGIKEGGYIHELNLSGFEETAVEAMEKFLKKYDLMLVDWIGCRWYEAGN